MRLPMTFQELLTRYSEDDVFPLEIDDALRETIKKWYKYRRICVINPEKFIVFFQRTLLAHYLRYRELLRIEPGIAKFDWLVETYREMQNTKLASISDDELKTLSGTVSGQNSGTKSASIHDIGEIVDDITKTRTNNLTDEIDETDSHSGSDITDKSDFRTDNLQNKITYSSKDKRTDALQDKTTYNSTSTTTNNSWKHTTETNGSATDSSYHAEIKKSNPMSASSNSNPVSTEALVTDGAQGQHIGVLNYEYRDSQALTNDKLGNVHKDKTTDTLSGSQAVAHTGNDTSNRTGTQDIDHSGSDTRNLTGTQRHDIDTTFTHGHTIDKDITISKTGSVIDDIDSTRETENTRTHTETIGGTKSETTTGRDTRTNTRSIEDLERERYTGRYTEIAKLLKRASEYISVTSAWIKFLKPELENCFYGTYVEEDDDE